MNGAHLHIMVNHLPVIGTLIAVAILAFALLLDHPVLTRTGLWMLVGLGVAGIAVYLTGEPAEEVLESLPGFQEAMVERHERAATVATTLLAVVGAGALGWLFVSRRRIPWEHRRTAGYALLAALVPAAAMGYAAFLGGQIAHEEIRPGGPAAGVVESPR